MTTDLAALATEQGVPVQVYGASLASLSRLMHLNAGAVADLAHCARDRSYRPFAGNGQVLADRYLIECVCDDGTVRMAPYMRALFLAVTEVHDDGDVSLNLPARGGE